ncbi:hypothetical protein [Billgrantia endophytica]|uniref:hypothetical protein n=1 Tax=Billgrantia endophytica TaxID=2033802 RepID=UPI0013FDD952|nr:hypothetical protein [Halomonas endophytica]
MDKATALPVRRHVCVAFLYTIIEPFPLGLASQANNRRWAVQCLMQERGHKSGMMEEKADNTHNHKIQNEQKAYTTISYTEAKQAAAKEGARHEPRHPWNQETLAAP